MVEINKINSDWTMEGFLFDETEEKFFVYSNERRTITLHFPKHSYYYKPLEEK
tara:strand:+ start:868 stop:1026 length:159 start_codon:yes stop_codon:yes gene_type:complete